MHLLAALRRWFGGKVKPTWRHSGSDAGAETLVGEVGAHRNMIESLRLGPSLREADASVFSDEVGEDGVYTGADRRALVGSLLEKGGWRDPL